LADVGERLNSSAFPAGSRKNIGACSPTSPLEADAGFDDEGDACAAKALRKRLPEVRDDLMAEDIEVDPLS
jgi:hypothetical protein